MENAGIPLWEMIIRLGVAALLGALLGMDREARDKPAGIRTYALVGLGSAAFTLVGLFFMVQWGEAPNVRMDLMRLISGVAGGVGFLGAGAIVQSQGDVRGLTTAASIWLIAGVGVACGVGAYRIAGVAVGFASIILTFVYFLEEWIKVDEKGRP